MTDPESSAAPDVLRPTVVRQLLDELGLRPRKALGQNFLIDRNILGHLLDAAAIGPGDTVLEVGPGLGAVTASLATLARRVVAVEKDSGLYAWLCRRFAGVPNVRLVHADALELRLDALEWPGEGPVRPDRVVSNLPYGAGSRILVELARAAQPPERVVVTVQREVADRLAAAPGGGDYGLLSLYVQRAFRVERVRTVGPRCFHPVPEVDSAIVRLQSLGAPPAAEAFYALSRQAFGQRRKQLARSLATPERAPDAVRAALASVAAAPTARAEDLSVAQWDALARALVCPG